MLVKEPMLIVGDMTFDDFCDWVDLGTKDDLIACLKVFESNNMSEAYTMVLKLRIDQMTSQNQSTATSL